MAQPVAVLAEGVAVSIESEPVAPIADGVGRHLHAMRLRAGKVIADRFSGRHKQAVARRIAVRRKQRRAA